MIHRDKKWLVGIMATVFVAGIIFRLWFITQAPQPFGYDQSDYVYYAKKMLDHNFLASHSYRPYPYSLFLAIVYSFFGFPNNTIVIVIQAALDSSIALMIFFLIRRVTKNDLIAILGLLLYAFNPFTSGYVGVLLTEVLSGFFIAATVSMGLVFLRKPTLAKGALLGLVGGLAAETRSAAFLWTAIPVGLTFLLVNKRQILPYVAILFGLFLIILYPLYVNWRDYRELNLTNVDSTFAREFFNGAILKVLPPFTYSYPPEVQQMYYEYYSEYYPKRTTEERKAMADKYFKKGLDIIKADPWDYIKVRFFKMWYVWQKENLFFYREPNFENHKNITYGINLELLGLSIVGLASLWKKKTGAGRFIFWSILGTIVYGSLVFGITHAEYRLTIPFYPLIIAAAAVGIGTLVAKIYEMLSLWLRHERISL